MPGHHGQSGTSMGVSQGGSTGHTGHPSAGVGGNNNQPAKTTTVPSGINIHRDTGIEEKPYVISGGKKHYKTGVDEEGNPSTVYNKFKWVGQGLSDPFAVSVPFNYREGRTKGNFNTRGVDQDKF